MSAGYNYKECSRTEAMYKYLNLLKTAQKVSTGTSEEGFGVPEKRNASSNQLIRGVTDAPRQSPRMSHQVISTSIFWFPEQIHSDVNNFTVSTEIPELIRKRKGSNDELITGVMDVPWQSRSKICRMNEKVISTSSEQDGIKSDFRMDMNSTNQNVLERNCFTFMNHGLTRFEESHSHNHGNQSLDISSNKKTFPIGQFTASNVNFPKNIRSTNKHSDSGSFEETASFSAANLSFPGPSQIFENIPQSNLRLKNFKYCSPLKPQAAIGQEKEYLMCWGCNKEVSTQVKENEVNQFKYCDCPYWCAVCGVGYYIEGSHEIKHTCNVCQETFPCRSHLEIHYFNHEKHHDIYCRLCQKELDEHIISPDENYYCCICTHKDYERGTLKAHLYTHSNLYIFKCTQCVKQYKAKRKFFNHLKNHKV